MRRLGQRYRLHETSYQILNWLVFSSQGKRDVHDVMQNARCYSKHPPNIYLKRNAGCAKRSRATVSQSKKLIVASQPHHATVVRWSWSLHQGWNKSKGCTGEGVVSSLIALALFQTLHLKLHNTSGSTKLGRMQIHWSSCVS